MKKKIFYFTDNLNLTQSLGNSFGPELSDPQNVFNVTSIQNATETVNAVSVCSGVLIAINNAELTNCVNLILMPPEQPETELPYVKYYIYRGVKRESLFDNGVMASAANNDLSASIWATQAVINGEYDKSNDNPIGTTNTPPVSNALEYEITIETDLNTPIYKLFNSFNNGEHQPPTVKGGWTLGEFNSENIGFEIVIEQIGYDLVLSDLCLNKNQIIAPSLGSSPSDLDRFNHWLEKEKILSYLSPCAFFGSFFNSKLYIKGNNTPFTGNNLISSFLKEHFIDANTVYIDIKNEHEYSYDFSRYYKGFASANQQASILINTNPIENNVNNFQLVDYSNHNNYNWPLLTLSSADFPLQTGNEKLKLDLSFPKMDLLNRILVVKQGELVIKKRKRSKKQVGNYSFPVFEPNAISCNPISFNLGNISSSSIDIVPSFLRLCYAKEAPQCPANLNQYNGNLELKNVHDLDNVFTPFSMTFPWNISDTEEPESPLSWLYHNEQYVDVMRTSGCSFIGKSGIAKDPNGDVTLFSFPVRKVLGTNKVQETPFSLTGRVDKVENEPFLKRLGRHYNIPTKNLNFSFNGQSRQVSYFGNLSSNSLNSFDSLSSLDFTFLKIQNIDFLAINDIYNSSNFIPGTKVHLALKHLNSNITFGSTPAGGPIIPPSPIDLDPDLRRTISEYEFVLIGYIQNGQSVELCSIDTSIFTYRIRNILTENLLIELSRNSKGIKHYEIFDIDNNFTIDPDPLKQVQANFQTNLNANPNLNLNLTVVSPLSSNNVKKRAIRCNIYLYRDDNLSPEQFCAYKTYFDQNIQLVWNSQSNLGLGAIYDALPAGIGQGTVQRNYWIDSSEVKVHEATNKHLQKLEKNEVLFIVTHNASIPTGTSNAMNIPVSYVYGENRKAGVMKYENIGTLNNYVPKIQNTNVPAHEFGHVLGLNDYYEHVGLVYNSSHKSHKNPIKQSNYVRIRILGTRFVPQNIDEEYATRYNWHNSLMSTMLNVGLVLPPLFIPAPLNEIVFPSTIINEATYQRYNELFLFAFISAPNTTSIFITSEQIEIICSYNTQGDKLPTTFFVDMKHSGAGSTIELNSIVGKLNGNLVSDKNFIHSNSGFDDSAHRMEMRTQTSNVVLGYFKAYAGINRLPSTIDFDSFSNVSKASKNQICRTDLMTNKISFNGGVEGWKTPRPNNIDNYGVNLILTDMAEIEILFDSIKLVTGQGAGVNAQSLAQIINNLLTLSPSAAAGAPVALSPSIHTGLLQIIQRYTSHYGKSIFIPKSDPVFDNFNLIGQGDEYGRSVWNAHAAGNSSNDDILNPFPIAVLDPRGSHSFDFLHRIRKLGYINFGSFSTNQKNAWQGNSNSGPIPPWSGILDFKLTFTYYYNREALI